MTAHAPIHHGAGQAQPNTMRRMRVSGAYLAVICAALGQLTTPAAADAQRAALPVAATPAAPNRVIGLTGAANFRDLGGYSTADGGHVRWTRVYRSNALGHLTPADAQRIDQLQLATVVDLRTEDERAQSPSVWLHWPTHVYESPQATLAPLMHTILNDAQTAAGARAGMITFYSRLPDSYHAEYAVFFQHVAAGHLPLLIHCTAGKDRTGVAAALLLRLVGVSRAQVTEDYTLTDRLVPAPVMALRGAAPAGGSALAALAQLPEESRVALWESSRQYLDAALDAVDRDYGSVEGYLIRGLGLTTADVTAIRHEMVQ